MKTLRLSIIIVIAIIVTVGIIATTFFTLENNLAKQNQEEKIQARVHVLTDNGTKYVRISDIAPNSAEAFVYPYADNTTLDLEANQRWELVRLPSEFGGDRNDISSLRAYSMVDIAIGCFVNYRSQSKTLVDICHDDTFEPVNGIAIAGNAVLNKYNALPNLELGVDDKGYIYVKQPVFEFDKNGLIGAGRDVFHCTDPTRTDLQYDIKHLTTRQQTESITLSDSRIQKIIDNNSCEFMADGILYTENGTYRTININLNNTKELSATVHLQNRSVISYELSDLTRTYPAK